jgi:hypothetical protein
MVRLSLSTVSPSGLTAPTVMTTAFDQAFPSPGAVRLQPNRQHGDDRIGRIAAWLRVAAQTTAEVGSTKKPCRASFDFAPATSNVDAMIAGGLFDASTASRRSGCKMDAFGAVCPS